MNIQNYMPKHAYVTFLRWWIIGWSLCLVIYLAAIVAFVVLMPNDRHGWQGVRVALLSFSPGALLAGYLIMSSYRELRSIKCASESGPPEPPGTPS
ncbi:MAG: hypothetical protein ABMA13_17145 [Chthoniobacteraceae bacterium]